MNLMVKKKMKEAPPYKEEVTTPGPVEVSVYTKHGNLIRTYSREVHGEKFAALAEQFSKGTPGSYVK
jgi:hypothetical protein